MRIRSALLALLLVTGYGAPVRGAGVDHDVNSLGLTARYEVDASIGWDDRRVTVDTTATVANDTRWTVSTVALNLATLRTGHAEVTNVTVDGESVDATIDDQTILVPLATPLIPGAGTEIAIDYDARLNASSSVDGDDWEFARIGDVLTAYRWIPWLTRTTPFNRPNVGDPFVTASSPGVNVTITTDRDVTFATSGHQTSPSGLTQTFSASDVRDFNLAASPSYQTASRNVAGTEVTFFYKGLPPASVLDTAARAIREYSSRIAPYPHQQLTIAEIGPWSPFESPGHFWLPSNASSRLLPWMVAHEVAHQWFYSAVGNDQAREPFADEAVADFISRDLISRFVPSQCPTGRLDHTIYDIGDCYAWVVYVQGDAWLRDLRDRIGGSRFYGALAAYYRTHRNGMGGIHDLLTSLVAAGGRNAVDYRRFPYTYPARVVSMPFGPFLR